MRMHSNLSKFTIAYNQWCSPKKSSGHTVLLAPPLRTRNRGGGVQIGNFQSQNCTFSLSCGTRDRGGWGGGANRNFFPLAVDPPSRQSLAYNDRGGGDKISPCRAIAPPASTPQHATGPYGRMASTTGHTAPYSCIVASSITTHTDLNYYPYGPQLLPIRTSITTHTDPHAVSNYPYAVWARMASTTPLAIYLISVTQLV